VLKDAFWERKGKHEIRPYAWPIADSRVQRMMRVAKTSQSFENVELLIWSAKVGPVMLDVILALLRSHTDPLVCSFPHPKSGQLQHLDRDEASTLGRKARQFHFAANGVIFPPESSI